MENQMQTVRQDQAVESGSGLPASSEMMKVLLTRAMQFPRDEQQALDSALKELEAVPGLAEGSYYSIPYESDGKKVPVEGLTIGSAMAIIRKWGNAMAGCRVINEDDKCWDLEATALDFESNVPISRPYRVSKFFKPRGGQNVMPLDHNRRLMAFQSGVSKSIRNVALAIIPEWFKSAYFEKAKDLVVNPPKKIGKVEKSIQERILIARETFFKKWKVTFEEMGEYLSGLALEDDKAVLVHLQGLYNGLSEGRESVDSVFGRVKPQPTMPREKK